MRSNQSTNKNPHHNEQHSTCNKQLCLEMQAVSRGAKQSTHVRIFGLAHLAVSQYAIHHINVISHSLHMRCRPHAQGAHKQILLSRVLALLEGLWNLLRSGCVPRAQGSSALLDLAEVQQGHWWNLPWRKQGRSHCKKLILLLPHIVILH